MNTSVSKLKEITAAARKTKQLEAEEKLKNLKNSARREVRKYLDTAIFPSLLFVAERGEARVAVCYAEFAKAMFAKAMFMNNITFDNAEDLNKLAMDALREIAAEEGFKVIQERDIRGITEIFFSWEEDEEEEDSYF